MSSILVSSGIDVDSFCSPSRGPTSTIRTSPALRRVLVEKPRQAHRHPSRLPSPGMSPIRGMAKAYNSEGGQSEVVSRAVVLEFGGVAGKFQLAFSRSTPGGQIFKTDLTARENTPISSPLLPKWKKTVLKPISGRQLMLKLVQRNKKSRNSQRKGSSGGKKQQNERRRGAIRVGLSKTVGLYRVCKEPRRSANENLTFCSCTTKKDGQSDQPSPSRYPQRSRN